MPVLSPHFCHKIGSTQLYRMVLLLHDYNFPSLEQWYPNLFQQDNAPVHQASAIKTCFAKIGVRLQSDLTNHPTLVPDLINGLVAEPLWPCSKIRWKAFAEERRLLCQQRGLNLEWYVNKRTAQCLHSVL